MNIRTPSKTLGIITGSGPEAGIDFWNKFLIQNRNYKGKDFSGDLDVPNTYIHSNPLLGLSMDLIKNEKIVWKALKEEILMISKRCDHFVITCNTLHYYQDKIIDFDNESKFISIVSILDNYLQKINIKKKAAILGINTVTNCRSNYSPFKSLFRKYNIEEIGSKEVETLHELVKHIKANGVSSKQWRILDSIIENIDAHYYFLACTELPLINYKNKSKKIIDLTELLAEAVIKQLYSDN